MAREVIKDALTEGAKATPPLVVLGKSIAEGWNINHTVAALTIVYLLMQIGWLAWRWRRAAQGVEVKAE